MSALKKLRTLDPACVLAVLSDAAILRVEAVWHAAAEAIVPHLGAEHE